MINACTQTVLCRTSCITSCTYATPCVWPRGTYSPYRLNLFVKERLRLNVPSIGRPASISDLIASARGACCRVYRDVTRPGLPALPVRPACSTGATHVRSWAGVACSNSDDRRPWLQAGKAPTWHNRRIYSHHHKRTLCK